MREQVLRASPGLAFLLENYPLGATPTANPLVDSYSRFQSLAIDENTASARLDHQFSERNRFFGRLNMNNSIVDGPLFSLLPSALGVTDFQYVPSKSRNVVLNFQRTVSGCTLAEFTAGMQRTMTEGSSDTPFPQVNITGLTVVPGSRRFNLSNSTMFQYGGSVSHVRGGHTLKAGLTLWRTRVNSWTTSFVSLTYVSLADFIANRMSQAALTAGTFGNGIRQSHYGAFVQDTWQLRPRLTLDLGLRYDYATPNHDPQGRLRVFDTRSLALTEPHAPWYRQDRNNFAPRLALAWQASSRHTTFSYTFGKAIDNVPDSGVAGTEPQDFRCLPCERVSVPPTSATTLPSAPSGTCPGRSAPACWAAGNWPSSDWPAAARRST